MALFDGSTTDQFRKYVPVTVNYAVDDVRPTLDATEDDLLLQFLGEDLTTAIVALSAEEPEDLSLPQKRALHLARVAVGKIGFARYLPFAEVQIGDDGITVSAADGRKAAFEYQTNKLERKLLDEGWRAMDELITLVAANETTFTDWPTSPYYREHQDALFKNAREFSRYYPIQDRWLTFWALRPFIRLVEESRGLTAQERIDALPAGVTTAQKERLTKKLLYALAYQSVIDALPNLSVELNGPNVQVNYASQYGNALYYEAPGEKHLTWVLATLQKQADLAWSAFDAAVGALLPAGPTDPATTDAGLIYSNGSITIL